jgi:hypothetical protein
MELAQDHISKDQWWKTCPEFGTFMLAQTQLSSYLKMTGGPVHSSGVSLILRVTTRSAVVTEKLMVVLLVKKFPLFYGIRGLLTTFARDRHWILSWIPWNRPTPSYTILMCVNVLIGFSELLCPLVVSKERILTVSGSKTQAMFLRNVGKYLSDYRASHAKDHNPHLHHRENFNIILIPT